MQKSLEIKENTWLIGKEDTATLMNEDTTGGLWRQTPAKLGGKYKMWSRFPQIPTLN